MNTSTTKERMKNYRARLRKEGLRPIQLWTVDQNGPEFKSEIRRQVANLKEEEEKQEGEGGGPLGEPGAAGNHPSNQQPQQQ